MFAGATCLKLDTEYKMFENYYGEYCARLNGEQSIFSDAAPDPLRSWLFRAVSATLFWIPEQCALKLQKVWVDGILLTSRWNDFLLEKRGEWEKTITPVPLHIFEIRMAANLLLTPGYRTPIG